MKPVGWGDEATPKVVQDLRTMLGGGLTFRDNINCAIVTVDCQHNTETRVANPLQTKPIAFVPISSMAITTIGGQSNGSARPIDGMPILNTSRTDGFLGVTVRYAPPAGIVDLRRNATQALASASITPVQFTVNEGGGSTNGTTITNGAFTFDITTTSGSPATNSKITCTESGFVDLVANVPFDTSVVGAKFAWLAKNNASGTRWGINAATVTGYFFSVPVARMQVTAGDYLQVFAYQDTGVSVNIIDDVNNHARVMARYVSPSLTALGRVTGILVGG